MKTTALAFPILLALAGCASVPPPSSISTAPVAKSLDRITGNLSEVDGKATVVESWLKQNCR